MRYILSLLFAITLLSCDETVPVTGDEPRDPLLDSADKYNQLFVSVKQNNIAFASIYADLALSYSEKAEYKQGLTNATLGKGYVAYRNGSYEEANHLLNAALSDYTSYHDSAKVAECNYYLAENFLAQKIYDSAMTSIEHGMNMHRGMNQSDKLSLDHQLAGKIHADQGDYKSAIPHFEESVATERKRGDSLAVAKALAALGSVYTTSGNADDGLKMHLLALKRIDSLKVDMSAIDVQRFKASLFNEMAGEYFLSGDYGQAIKTGEAGLALASMIGAQEEKRAAYKTLAELQGLAGREDVQMQYTEKYIAINDTITKAESEQWLSAAQYRCALIQNEVEEVRVEKEALQQTLTEQNQQCKKTIMLVCVAAIAMVLGIIGVAIAMWKKFRK